MCIAPCLAPRKTSTFPSIELELKDPREHGIPRSLEYNVHTMLQSHIHNSQCIFFFSSTLISLRQNTEYAKKKRKSFAERERKKVFFYKAYIGVHKLLRRVSLSAYVVYIWDLQCIQLIVQMEKIETWKRIKFTTKSNLKPIVQSGKMSIHIDISVWISIYRYRYRYTDIRTPERDRSYIAHKSQRTVFIRLYARLNIQTNFYAMNIRIL